MDRLPEAFSEMFEDAEGKFGTGVTGGGGVLSQSSIFGQNPKIWCQEFNGLQTPKCSKKPLCDRTEPGTALFSIWMRFPMVFPVMTR